jgi:hypothetical protein
VPPNATVAAPLACATSVSSSAETSLTTLNHLRAELAGRRIDVDVS